MIGTAALHPILRSRLHDVEVNLKQVISEGYCTLTQIDVGQRFSEMNTVGVTPVASLLISDARRKAGRDSRRRCIPSHSLQRNITLQGLRWPLQTHHHRRLPQVLFTNRKQSTLIHNR